MCGVGAVLGRSLAPVKFDFEKRIIELRSVPIGTRLVCRSDDARTRRGVLVGVEEIDGRIYVVINIGAGVRHLIPEDRCGCIELMDGQASILHRLRSLHAAKVGLVSGVFSGGNRKEFLTASRLDCVIVAHERELVSEVRETNFAIASDHELVEGNLQDLLRVKRFGREGDSHRSDVIATNWQVRPARHKDPPVVVFDGANEFLRWGEEWPNAHYIILLDRRESRFDDAVAVLNSQFIKNRADTKLVRIPPVPASVECMLFGTERS